MDTTEDFNEPKQDCSPVSYDRAAHHIKCLTVDCGWRAEEVLQCLATLRAEIDESKKARDVSGELLSSLAALLDMIERLPWQIRWAVYNEHSKRKNLLPGTLPPEVAAARDAICGARGGSDWRKKEEPAQKMKAIAELFGAENASL